jgi:hypothetical protein
MFHVSGHKVRESVGHASFSSQIGQIGFKVCDQVNGSRQFFFFPTTSARTKNGAPALNESLI